MNMRVIVDKATARNLMGVLGALAATYLPSVPHQVLL
jgi:hypothetical protein